MNDTEDGTYHYPSLPQSPHPGYSTAVYQEIEKPSDSASNSEVASDAARPGDRGEYAYDLLEPTDNRRNGSESVPKEMGGTNGYQTPTSKSEGPSTAPKVPSGTTGEEGGSNGKGPQPARVANDYLEILPDPDEPIPSNASKDEEPALAHQELYQHLHRPENPYHTSAQASPKDPGEDSSTPVTEEEYGTLDIATKNDNPNQPDYFTLDTALWGIIRASSRLCRYWKLCI